MFRINIQMLWLSFNSHPIVAVLNHFYSKNKFSLKAGSFCNLSFPIKKRERTRTKTIKQNAACLKSHKRSYTRIYQAWENMCSFVKTYFSLKSLLDYKSSHNILVCVCVYVRQTSVFHFLMSVLP